MTLSHSATSATKTSLTCSLVPFSESAFSTQPGRFKSIKPAFSEEAPETTHSIADSQALLKKLRKPQQPRKRVEDLLVTKLASGRHSGGLEKGWRRKGPETLTVKRNTSLNSQWVSKWAATNGVWWSMDWLEDPSILKLEERHWTLWLTSTTLPHKITQSTISSDCWESWEEIKTFSWKKKQSDKSFWSRKSSFQIELKSYLHFQKT